MTLDAEECDKWLLDCLKIFPTLTKKGIKIKCVYRGMGANLLGRVHGNVNVKRDIDPVSVLLKGIGGVKLRRKLGDSFIVEISDRFLKVKNEELREQTVKSVIIHELLHIERRDMIEQSKDYSRRRRKKIHTGLDEEALKMYNTLRRLEGLPEIRNKDDLKAAVNKVFESAYK